MLINPSAADLITLIQTNIEFFSDKELDKLDMIIYSELQARDNDSDEDPEDRSL